MKPHVKIYIEYFGYCLDGIIPSEISGLPANDLHHIIYKSRGGKDNIDNLIALTREEHIKAHNNDLDKDTLQEIHNHYLNDFHSRKRPKF